MTVRLVQPVQNGYRFLTPICLAARSSSGVLRKTRTIVQRNGGLICISIILQSRGSVIGWIVNFPIPKQSMQTGSRNMLVVSVFATLRVAPFGRIPVALPFTHYRALNISPIRTTSSPNYMIYNVWWMKWFLVFDPCLPCTFFPLT